MFRAIHSDYVTRSEAQVEFENELRAFKQEVDFNLRQRGIFDSGPIRCTLHHSNTGRDLLVVMPGMFTIENQPSEKGNAAARWVPSMVESEINSEHL